MIAADPLDAVSAALRDARDNGLIYWEPNTERGHVAKAQMLARVDAVLVNAEGRDTLRGDDTERLPDHAALWARMPLPFTPAQAWRLLTPETQAEIGAALIGQYLAEYVSGQMHEDEVDRFLDEGLRDAAGEAAGDILNRMDDRLWAIFPDLYGPDADHPAWAHAAGMVHPLGAILPKVQVAPARDADPIFAAIGAADTARQAHQGIFDAGLDEDDAEQMARLDTLRDTDREAFAALAAVIPTTRDGDVALADFYLRTLDDRDGQATTCLKHLRNVLAGGEA